MAQKINVEKFLEKIKGISLEQTEQILEGVKAQVKEKKIEVIKQLENQAARLRAENGFGPANEIKAPVKDFSEYQ